jgi:hypothetical protein
MKCASADRNSTPTAGDCFDLLELPAIQFGGAERVWRHGAWTSECLAERDTGGKISQIDNGRQLKV